MADGDFVLRFGTEGVRSVAPPPDFGPDDWELQHRVVGAVRDAIDPPTVVLPIQPTTGVEDTQPLSAWFTP